MKLHHIFGILAGGVYGTLTGIMADNSYNDPEGDRTLEGVTQVCLHGTRLDGQEASTGLRGLGCAALPGIALGRFLAK